MHGRDRGRRRGRRRVAARRALPPRVKPFPLLNPLNMVDKEVNAISLSGGSAFGLDTGHRHFALSPRTRVGWDTRASPKVPRSSTADIYRSPGRQQTHGSSGCRVRLQGRAGRQHVAGGRRQRRRGRRRGRRTNGWPRPRHEVEHLGASRIDRRTASSSAPSSSSRVRRPHRSVKQQWWPAQGTRTEHSPIFTKMIRSTARCPARHWPIPATPRQSASSPQRLSKAEHATAWRW